VVDRHVQIFFLYGNEDTHFLAQLPFQCRVLGLARLDPAAGKFIFIEADPGNYTADQVLPHYASLIGKSAKTAIPL